MSEDMVYWAVGVVALVVVVVIAIAFVRVPSVLFGDVTFPMPPLYVPPDLSTFSCRKCNFYDTGRCKRWPPTWKSNLGGLGAWPGAQHDDRCGEFSRRYVPPDS